MTLDKAREILRSEHGLELVDVYHEADLQAPHYWVAATRDGKIKAEGKSWGEVFVQVTGEAPI